MNKQIDIELVQDAYTNFIVYDGSDRTNTQIDWIDVSSVNKVEVVFKSTSEHLTDDMNYIIDSSQLARHIGNVEFFTHDFSGFEGSEQLLVNVNGNDYELMVNGNMTSITMLVNDLNSQLTDSVFFFIEDGNYVEMRTWEAGSEQVIIPVVSQLGTRLGFRPGVYRGNDIVWGSTLTQKDLFHYIYIADLGFVDNIPDGQWDIEVYVEYVSNIPPTISSYQSAYTEFTYKLTEIFRAKMFEYIAKNFKDFEMVEQRAWTTVEKTMYSTLQYDAAYKSFVAALDVGNTRACNTILSYLINYRILNPIS